MASPQQMENLVSLERSEAIVLRGVDFSETSRVVTFLSPSRGRLACMAKGARRVKSSFAGLLETFHRLEIVYTWKDSRAVQQLTDASLLDSFDGITGDLDRGAYATFPLEVAYKVSQENQPSESLYGCLVADFEGLAVWDGPIETYSAWQVLRLLSIAGFAPAWEHCCDCGSPIDRRPGFAFAGGIVCDKCRADRRLSPEEYAAFVALMTHEDGCPAVDLGPNLFAIIADYGRAQLESDLRSVRVIHQMYGGHNRTRIENRN